MTKPKTISVLVFPVGAPSYTQEIESGLKPMQELVGGYIEMPTLFHRETHSIDICCNEEGKLNNLEPNRPFRGGDVIFGQFFVTVTGNDGEARSLSSEDVADARKFFGE